MPTGQEGREAHPGSPWLLVKGPSEPRGPKATGRAVPGMAVLSRTGERTQLHLHLLPGRGVLRLYCTEGASLMLG